MTTGHMRMKTRQGALAAVAMLALAACSTPPLPERAAGVPVPASWSDASGETAEASAIAHWWQHFGDPLLSELVARAMASSTDVRVAQAKVRQARAAREQALAGLRPGVNATAQTQRNDQAGGGTTRQVQGSLEAAWDIDLFGASRRGAQATQAELQASDASLADTQLAVAAEVAGAYVQLRGTQARLAVARESLLAQRQLLQITQWRTQAGLASSLDLAQSQAAVAQLQAQVPPLDSAVAQTVHALSVLVGAPPLSFAAQLEAPAPIPEPPGQLTLVIPAQVLRQRPDIRASELAVDAAAARVSQSHGITLPSFALRSSVAWSAMALSSLGGTAARALIGSTSLPLLDGGSRRAQQDTQQAQFDAAQAAHDATVLAALQEVEDLLATLAGLRAQLAALRTAEESAGHAALLASTRYASGLADFQTVLETQRSWLSSRDGVATARTALAAGHVRLYRALGGGWTPAGPDADTPKGAGS
jgi:NodT family efflux transporter outer membrane factor (OMF) lipoprotein